MKEQSAWIKRKGDVKCEWLAVAYKRRRRCYLNVIASPFICVQCIDCLHLFSVCLSALQCFTINDAV